MENYRPTPELLSAATKLTKQLLIAVYFGDFGSHEFCKFELQYINYMYYQFFISRSSQWVNPSQWVNQMQMG